MGDIESEIDDLERDEDVPDACEQLDQLQADDTLIERGVDDVLDEGYVTREGWSSAERFGNTAAEQRQGPSLDDWLKQEEPDVGSEDRDRYPSGDESVDDEGEIDHEVGGFRAGRITAVASGGEDDPADDVFGSDVGIDGGAASAEEAAMHIIDDSED